MSQQLVSVQVLRFLAALLVVSNHCVERSGGLFANYYIAGFGGIGVDLFFAISGFVITEIAFRTASPPTAGDFLRRRWLRVVPIYLLMSLPWLAIHAAEGDLSLGAALASLTFWPAYEGTLQFPLLSVGWTLSFEMLFYLAAGLVLWSGRYRGVAIGLLFAAFAAFSALRVSTGLPAYQFLGNPMILEFLFGVAVAILWRQGSPRRWLGWACVGLAAASLTWVCALGVYGLPYAWDTLNGTNAAARAVRFGLPAALLLFGLLHLEDGFKGRIGRLLGQLGDASYALYLAHPLVIYLVWRPLAPLGPLWAMAIELALSIVIGLAVHHGMEKPLLRIFRKGDLGSRARAMEPATAGAP